MGLTKFRALWRGGGIIKEGEGLIEHSLYWNLSAFVRVIFLLHRLTSPRQDGQSSCLRLQILVCSELLIIVVHWKASGVYNSFINVPAFSRAYIRSNFVFFYLEKTVPCFKNIVKFPRYILSVLFAQNIPKITVVKSAKIRRRDRLLRNIDFKEMTNTKHCWPCFFHVWSTGSSTELMHRKYEINLADCGLHTMALHVFKNKCICMSFYKHLWNAYCLNTLMNKEV